VSDQGIGIKGGDTSSLGKMFKHIEIKDNVNQNGIGFGLTVSKLIIDKLGGSLRIKAYGP
jgi:K+-sensing histidine kinase KdpD